VRDKRIVLAALVPARQIGTGCEAAIAEGGQKRGSTARMQQSLEST
jgi:hypothetical protein